MSGSGSCDELVGPRKQRGHALIASVTRHARPLHDSAANLASVAVIGPASFEFFGARFASRVSSHAAPRLRAARLEDAIIERGEADRKRQSAIKQAIALGVDVSRIAPPPELR